MMSSLCTAKKSPEMVQQNTAVMWRFSFEPIISMWLAPSLAMVQVEDGTILMSVWSQFIVNSVHTTSIPILSTTASRNCCFLSAKSAIVYLLWEVVNFLKKNFKCWNNEYAQCLVILTCPPYLVSAPQFNANMNSFAAVIAKWAETHLHGFVQQWNTVAAFHQSPHQANFSTPFLLLHGFRQFYNL